MSIMIPHYNDTCLDQWIIGPKPTGSSRRFSPVTEDDISEVLKRFHIGSNKATTESSFPRVLLPPILQSQQPNDWLSSPTHKRAKMDKNVTSREDLSKWLVGKTKDEKKSEAKKIDTDKWLIRSAPSASSVTSLPGVRVEFNLLPTSAFKPVSREILETSTNAQKKSQCQYSEWLASPAQQATNNPPMQTEDDEDEIDSNLLSQWLMIDQTNSSQAVGSSMYSKASIEEWLMSAAENRDPSIVVISDDEFEDFS